ncbi:MAG: hypothetical protein AAGH68_07315 [Pseudomonadota bacterium]
MIRLLLCLILIAVPARAEMPEGHDDPRFQAAVDLWFTGDDQAIERFETLAEQNNIAAIVVLATIPVDYRYQRYWKRLEAAAESSSLAHAILASGSLPNTASELNQTVEALLDHDEFARAFRYIGRATRGWRQVEHDIVLEDATIERLMGPSVPLLQRLKFLGQEFSEHVDRKTLAHWGQRLCAETVSDGRHIPLVYLCSETDEEKIRQMNLRVFGGDFSSPQSWADKQIAEWLMSEVSDISLSCRKACPRRENDCSLVLFSMDAAFYGRVGFGSPSLLLISDADYVRSKRAQLDLWHHIWRLFPAKDSVALASVPDSFPKCLMTMAAEYREIFEASGG